MFLEPQHTHNVSYVCTPPSHTNDIPPFARAIFFRTCVRRPNYVDGSQRPAFRLPRSLGKPNARFSSCLVLCLRPVLIGLVRASEPFLFTRGMQAFRRHAFSMRCTTRLTARPPFSCFVQDTKM